MAPIDDVSAEAKPLIVTPLIGCSVAAQPASAERSGIWNAGIVPAAPGEISADHVNVHGVAPPHSCAVVFCVADHT